MPQQSMRREKCSLNPTGCCENPRCVATNSHARHHQGETRVARSRVLGHCAATAYSSYRFAASSSRTILRT